MSTLTCRCVCKQLKELGTERNKLQMEKAEMENQLEAESEYIVNRLQTQVVTSTPFDAAAQNSLSSTPEEPVVTACRSALHAAIRQ